MARRSGQVDHGEELANAVERASIGALGLDLLLISTHGAIHRLGLGIAPSRDMSMGALRLLAVCRFSLVCASSLG